MPKVISMEDIKTLREKTNAGIMDAKKALEESNGDMEKAEEWIRQKGMQRAEKKADRETKAGIIASYVHMGKIGVLVELNCETDFVAKTDAFVNLGKEIAMQVSSMNPESVDELLAQAYIREASKTIAEVVKETAGKVGENVTVKRIVRFELGA